MFALIKAQTGVETSSVEPLKGAGIDQTSHLAQHLWNTTSSDRYRGGTARHDASFRLIA